MREQMDFKISRSMRKCETCEKDFCAGAEYFCAISEGDGEFARREYCAQCWESDTGRAAAEGAYSYWRTGIPERTDEKRSLDVAAASTFFRRLAGSEEPHKRNFAYLLALLLMRKKVLLLEETVRESGKDFLVLRFRGEDAEDSFRAEDPRLPVEELEKVKDELGQLLDADE